MTHPKTPRNPKGAGRPRKEPRKVLSIRVKANHFKELKKIIKSVVKDYEK